MSEVHVRFRRRTPGAPVQVILYGRPGCHLCEDARRLLEDLSRANAVEVSQVDIETDDSLVAEYAVRIPVVASAETGEVLAEGVVERKALDASLRRISRSR